MAYVPNTTTHGQIHAKRGNGRYYLLSATQKHRFPTIDQPSFEMELVIPNTKAKKIRWWLIEKFNENSLEQFRFFDSSGNCCSFGARISSIKGWLDSHTTYLTIELTPNRAPHFVCR